MKFNLHCGISSPSYWTLHAAELALCPIGNLSDSHYTMYNPACVACHVSTAMNKARDTCLCRYDRSLWPKEATSVPTTRPASLHEGRQNSEQDTKQPVMTRSALQSLKQRMATVLDVELSNAA